MIKKQYKQSQDHRQLSEFVNEKTINALEELGAEENKMEEQKIKQNEPTTEQVSEQPDIDNLKVFEAGKSGVDLAEFEGTRVSIIDVSIIDSISSYDEKGHFQEGLKRPVKKIKVITDKVTEIKTEKDGQEQVYVIRASELFNMAHQEGQWGISSHPKAAIQKFLVRQKVQNVKDLVGTLVTVKAVENKDGKVFLGFITE